MPVGVLSAGRMGNHWGLGMLANGGDCLDCNGGDAVDRLAFITDTADQVVSVLVVDSGGRARTANEPDTGGYHTYNFITGKAKYS